MDFVDRHNIPELALAWHRAGRKVAIATVIETWGSAPRRAGSQMIVDADGHMEGSVSGGCVEGAVILAAQEAIETEQPKLLSFGVSDDDAFAVGLACGGEIKVLVDPVGPVMPLGVLDALVEAHRDRVPIGWVADTGGQERRIVDKERDPDQLARQETGLMDDAVTFVAQQRPVLRMIIIGAVHIAQHLSPMAKACGFDPIIVDPRPVFANDQRFDGAMLCDAWPDDALADIGLDPRTCVITLTHDAKLDDPALQSALGSDVFYIGALGSRRTHAKRTARLLDAGFDAKAIARIHAPVGQDIGAIGPAEIAVSIMAQVIAARRGKP